MTTKKKNTPENPPEDDYYVVEKKRIAKETQKLHRIHEEDIHLHLVANIPFYEDAPDGVRTALVRLNNVLIHRFDEPGMIYWDFFKKTPKELYDYASDFDWELSEQEQTTIVTYFERKKHEEDDMVDIGFDEDGEEDDIVLIDIEDDLSSENDVEKDY